MDELARAAEAVLLGGTMGDKFGKYLCASVLALFFPLASYAAPAFDATYNGSLTARLDWSSDLGVDLVNTTGVFLGTGVPVTVSASAVRDGRVIEANITQTTPNVLQDQYWAGSWSGLIKVPGPGLYGLQGTSGPTGAWLFSIPGQTPAEVLAQRYYFASIWDVSGPSDIHPIFLNAIHAGAPLSGTSVGNFTLAELFSFGLSGFPVGLTFSGQTFSLDINQPGTVNFSYRIAFSTTPIDARVFDPDPPPGRVPEPSTILLIAAGLIGFRFMRYRRAT